LAPLSVPLSGSVPVSLATLAVMISGLVLRPYLAFLSQVAYVLLGVAGLPVFSSFQSGLQVLVGVTGGFLWMYPALALLTSMGVRRGCRWPLLRLLPFVLAGQGLLYFSGAIWYSVFTHAHWSAAVVPFIWPECVKIVAAAVLFYPIQKIKIMIDTGGHRYD